MVPGPILFIVYIHYLCSGRFHGNLTYFADDTALKPLKNTHKSIKHLCAEVFEFSKLEAFKKQSVLKDKLVRKLNVLDLSLEKMNLTTIYISRICLL